MLYPILLVFLILSVYKVFFRIFDKNSRRKVAQAANAQEAVELRQKLFKRRQLLFRLFIVFQVIVILGLSFVAIGFLISLVVLFVELKYNRPKSDLYGNISYYTQESFLKSHDRFFLYLRGFDSDIPFGEEKTEGHRLFEEATFAEVVDYATSLPLCALGMTKEVDSPLGAIRVYVNDEDWKEKVHELMLKAEQVFILINSRSSCIWEIEQSYTLQDKTIFIVDDIEKFAAVKDLIGTHFRFPVIPESPSLPFFFKSGQPIVHFENSWEGYFDLLGLDYHVIEEQKVAERKEQKLANAGKEALKPIITIAAVLLLIVLLALLL